MDEMAIYSGYLPIREPRPEATRVKKQETRSSHSPPEFLHGIWRVRKWPIIVKGMSLTICQKRAKWIPWRISDPVYSYLGKGGCRKILCLKIFLPIEMQFWGYISQSQFWDTPTHTYIYIYIYYIILYIYILYYICVCARVFFNLFI